MQQCTGIHSVCSCIGEIFILPNICNGLFQKFTRCSSLFGQNWNYDCFPVSITWFIRFVQKLVAGDVRGSFSLMTNALVVAPFAVKWHGTVVIECEVQLNLPQKRTTNRYVPSSNISCWDLFWRMNALYLREPAVFSKLTGFQQRRAYRSAVAIKITTGQ